MPETNETVGNDTLTSAANAAAATAHLANGTGELAAPDSPTINIVDLQNAVKVIDFAAEQGAFKGWQIIKQVMAVRDKLDEFVLAANPPAAAPAEPANKPTKKRSKK